MNKLRVAVIATGFTGLQHVEAVRRIPNTEIVALVDSNLEQLRAKADRLGVEQIFTDYKEMIDVVKPDVVHNCTPNGMHYEINKYVISKGIHIYCEKPLATELEQGIELTQLAKSAQVAAGVNYNYRNNAMVQEMRARIVSGEFGKVFHITGQYAQDWLMYETDFNWRLDLKDGGKSRAIADIGSHWFDTAQWATGLKIVAVRANLLTAHKTRKKPTAVTETFTQNHSNSFEDVEISSEDAGFVLLKFENGSIGQFFVSQVSGGHANDLRIEIAGDRYSMEWCQETPDQLRIGTRENGIQYIKASPDRLHGDAVRYATLPGGHPVAWTDALRNGIREYYQSIVDQTFKAENQSYATFADATRIMKLVDACLLSDQSDCWTPVD